MFDIKLALLVILIVLIAYYFYCSAEHLGQPWFLDMASMEYSDPTFFNYLGRSERDVEGNSMQDYYLQNQMDAATGVLPQMFNDAKFFNQDGYMDMPVRNRPLRDPSQAKMQIQAALYSNNLEEWMFQDLNTDGQY